MRKGKLAFAALLAALVTTAVLLAVGATAGSASPKSAKAAFKVAWIYVGPHNDGGWSQAHDAGRLYVQKMLGSKVQTTYKENIAVGAQLQQTVASLVNQGYKMIFGTSYGFFDKKLAAKYPSVLFEQATGTDTAKNLSEYFGAAEDTVYLSGMAAGAAAKGNTIGYVVAYPIPEVIRHANAFALGAQAMHPGLKVKLVWTNSWFDPAKEKKAAESLHSAGADCARPERRLARDRAVRRVGRGPVGGLRLRCAEVRAEVLADRVGLQLGPVLPQAREGRDGRHVEVRLLLREHQGRLHGARAVRPERHRRDEVRNREEEAADREWLVLRVHRSAVRPERQACASRRARS